MVEVRIKDFAGFGTLESAHNAGSLQLIYQTTGPGIPYGHAALKQRG
jgi:hypothetical protein